jgi:hypothetical protein
LIAVVIPVCPKAAVVVVIDVTAHVAVAHVEQVEFVISKVAVAVPQADGAEIVYVPIELVFGVTAPVIAFIDKPAGVAV